MCIINLNGNYYYLRFVYLGVFRRISSASTTKALANRSQVRENTNRNENDSHYEVDKRLAPLPASFHYFPTQAMIVCVCNNISDREIRKAVDLGLTSMADLYRELGVGTCCGTCVRYARQVMHEHLDSTTVAGQPRITELRRTPQDGQPA
jgi:bacterioferritin-associated ferredoxin